jgi:AcrR family transcriptional regulator
MLERGSEDFTLQDVSRDGSVSIGSIYLRFDGKDDLVRAVIAQSDKKIGDAEDAMFTQLRQHCTSLDAFMPLYVEAYAGVLQTHAPLLRLSMERAAFDPLVSGHGKARAKAAADAATQAMLQFEGEIAGADKKAKAEASYQIIFATLARRLSLGSTMESVDDYDWSRLKLELGKMCLAYLKHGD